jgi:hypothetical protein
VNSLHLQMGSGDMAIHAPDIYRAPAEASGAAGLQLRRQRQAGGVHGVFPRGPGALVTPVPASRITERCKMHDTHTLQGHLALRAAELKTLAETLPQGDARDVLTHKAIKMEAASLVIERWMSSPGLRAPRSAAGLPTAPH